MIGYGGVKKGEESQLNLRLLTWVTWKTVGHSTEIKSMEELLVPFKIFNKVVNLEATLQGLRSE